MGVGVRKRTLSVLAVVALLGAELPVRAAHAGGPSLRPPARLELRDLSGRPRSLRELHGKVVLVNFWATWCGPCVDELPILAELAQRYRDAGLVVVAASVDDARSRDAVEAFARKSARGLEVWIGADEADMEALGLGGNAVPATLLLDRGGRVARRMQGAVSRGDLDPMIHELLREEGGHPDGPRESPRLPHHRRTQPGLPEAAAPPPGSSTSRSRALVLLNGAVSAPEQACSGSEVA